MVTFYMNKITGPYATKVSRSRKTKQDSGSVTDWRRLRGLDNYMQDPGLDPRPEKTFMGTLVTSD